MIEPNPETRLKFIEEYQDKQKNGTITPTETDALASLIKEEEEYQASDEAKKSTPKVEEKTEEKSTTEETSEEKKEDKVEEDLPKPTQGVEPKNHNLGSSKRG